MEGGRGRSKEERGRGREERTRECVNKRVMEERERGAVSYLPDVACDTGL